MTTSLKAALILQAYVWEPDTAPARRLRRLRAKARRAGAALDDLAFAVALRSDRLAGDVITWEADAEDTRPAPDDRCVYCDGWGYFPDTDGEGLDGDLPCGQCSETGIEP